MNALENLRDTMRAAGLDYAGPIVADGRLHRIRVHGDTSRNSWFVIHTGPPAGGAFGCWKRGLKETWHDQSNPLSQPDWDRLRAQWQAAGRERERAETERHARVSKIAERIMRHAQPATAHAYLEAKGVRPHGDICIYRGALVLPLRTAAGTLHSLQFIAADGAKKFLPGGRIAGCSFTIKHQPDGPLVLCEGYATGASLHEATGHTVVCAMHAGNLRAVGESLRAKYPTRKIIVAADNDQFTDDNPGLTKATAAAKMISAKLAVPQFIEVAGKPTDFNDLHRLANLAEVARQIGIANAATPPSNIFTPGTILSVENDEPTAPEFPVDCLPPDLALMGREVALALRVPDSLPCSMVLAFTAASIGKGLVLDWRAGKPPTPANLFVLLSAASGTGKSESFKLVAEPFQTFERAMQERWRTEVLPQLQGDLRHAEGQLKKLDRKLLKDSTTQEEADHCRSQMTFHLAQIEALKGKLHEPQLSIQDATVEKAATVMHWNNEAIFSTSSDARKLADNLLGRYSANKNLADDGIYLNAFSGDDVKVDRQGRESVRLANPCLTLLWALQPDALNMLLGEASLQQGGFLARCLLAHTHAEPQHLGGDERGISDDTRGRWQKLTRTLLAAYRRPPTLPVGELAEFAAAHLEKPHHVEATPGARALFRNYFNEIVDRRRAGELSDVAEYASRWCEQAARIGLVLHAGLHGAAAHQHPLLPEAAENSIRLARWYAEQQLGLLTKGRRAAAVQVEEEIIALLDDRAQGRRLEPKERALGRPIDWITARTVRRARIVVGEAADTRLTGMECDGLLTGEDVRPPHGGQPTRIFRKVKNPVPE